MNHSTEYLERIAKDIGKAAEILSRQFPTIDYDDIYQNLWVYVLERKTELAGPEDNGTPVNFLVQAGQRQCGKELAAANPRADDFYYSPKSVRKLLDEGYLFYVGKDVAGRSDLLSAYEALGAEAKEHIRRAFLDGNAEHRKPGAVAMAVKRAVENLAMEMNRIGESRSEWHKERAVSGWTGSRKQVSTVVEDR